MKLAIALSTMVEVTGGELFNGGEGACIRGVTLDSRRIEPGNLFVAVAGDQVDGHDFIAAAAEAGAGAALVSHWVPSSLPQIVVADVRQAVTQLAVWRRAHFPGPVIGITGSAGKTSTKELVRAVLACQYRVYATQGNQNNEWGVPLTLLNAPQDCDALVVEMGARQAGDIDYLCQIAKPLIGVVTNAVGAHLGVFGSMDALVETKGELYRALSSGGVALINGDSPYAARWQQMAGAAELLYFGFDCGADIRAEALQCDARGCQFQLCLPLQPSVSVRLSLLGAHNVSNALVALAIGHQLGIDVSTMCAALEQVQPPQGRLTVQQVGGRIILDDSYNANPAAVEAALAVLALYPGRRAALLGTMAELGEESLSAHRQVAEKARQLGIEVLWAVGEYAAAQSECFGPGGRAFASRAQMLEAIDQLEADAVLVKGSRSAAMERVVERLCAGENR